MAHIPFATLSRFTRGAVARMGMHARDAEIFADVLVSGSLRSHPSQNQGVQQLPLYWSRMQEGVVNRTAMFEVVRQEGSTALTDAHDGLGHVMSVHAMELAIKMALEVGAGVVAVRHSTHFGIAAYYPLLAMRHGCIGIAFSNAAPEIAPWGGSRATVGTNPWAVGVPSSGDAPVVLDMATSTSGKGAIEWHLRAGLPIPQDWALTAEGERTEDAAAGMLGTLFPLGGPKGYAMAVIIDALTGVLTGSAFGPAVFASRRHDVGHLMIAIDISRFLPLDSFNKRMESFITQIRSSPITPGSGPVLLPGEIEYRREQEARRLGVPIPREKLAALQRLGEELHVPVSLSDAVAE